MSSMLEVAPSGSSGLAGWTQSLASAALLPRISVASRTFRDVMVFSPVGTSANISSRRAGCQAGAGRAVAGKEGWARSLFPDPQRIQAELAFQFPGQFAGTGLRAEA